MSTFTAFPDVEAGLLVALEDLGYTVTSTPIDMKDILAGVGAYTVPADVIRIQRIGGAHGENRATDEPRVTVDVFKLRDPTNPRAPIQKALAVEARLLSLSDSITIPAEFGGGRCRIDGVVTESGPVEFPWPDPDIQVVRLISRASTRR